MCSKNKKNQQGYVNLLIELSPKLLESSIRYGNNIAIWANKVETRYKEFFNIMSKVQQAHGLHAASNSISTIGSSSLSLASLPSTQIASNSILNNSFDSQSTKSTSINSTDEMTSSVSLVFYRQN